MALMEQGQQPQQDLQGRFGIAQDNDVVGVPEDFRTRQAVQSHVREDITIAARFINENVADGREKSLALTHLEEALMWAGKAIFA